MVSTIDETISSEETRQLQLNNSNRDVFTLGPKYIYAKSNSKFCEPIIVYYVF